MHFNLDFNGILGLAALLYSAFGHGRVVATLQHVLGIQAQQQQQQQQITQLAQSQAPPTTTLQVLPPKG